MDPVERTCLRPLFLVPKLIRSVMSAPESNQTISYLARRFSETGIRLKTRHGQNFLIDLNLQRLIVERAQLEPCDVVLEVGTGTGALTAIMAPRVAAVVTVEIDPQLSQLASEELFGLPNVVMLEHDALQNKSHLHPGVIAAVQEQLAAGPQPPTEARGQLAL